MLNMFQTGDVGAGCVATNFFRSTPVIYRAGFSYKSFSRGERERKEKEQYISKSTQEKSGIVREATLSLNKRC